VLSPSGGEIERGNASRPAPCAPCTRSFFRSRVAKTGNMPEKHEKFMKRAISLARRGMGKTSPNPAVGCVIVRDGVIVGEGWHRKAGGLHAEVFALGQAGDKARGGDVYVTLEPCSHHGKTPPCADALVRAGVRKVFAAMIDPNPVVAGRGVALLRAAGIEVTTGLMETESRLLNEPFIKMMTTGRPFVILKSAVTLDGKTSTEQGDSKWISSEKSRKYVHKLRGMVDAIMVGARTVAADDPELTCRIPGGKDPARVVVDSRLGISSDARLFHLASTAPTIVATLVGTGAKADAVRACGGEILICRERDGRVDLADLLDRLGRRGIQSVLLEGGSTLAGEALRQGYIDKIMLFLAPKLVGGEGPGLFAGRGAEQMSGAFRLKEMSIRRFDTDILVTGYPEVPCLPA
jgi:diaminohydroxyphosphoribosylaminopyrimidine deaminase/5-amino-6-(5-phosphoribosylamino)uracil reductase